MNPASLVGKKIGQYEIWELIGKGRISSVYLAYQPASQKEVAIKVYPAPPPEDPDIPAFLRKERSIDSLLSKAAKLDHPHLVPILDYGRSGDVIFAVMTRMRESLSVRLKAGWQFDFGETSRLMMEIASALDYSHKNGFICGDITPRNILFDSQNTACLGDCTGRAFSNLLRLRSDLEERTEPVLARTVTEPGNKNVSAIFSADGWTAYISPEQWRGVETLTSAVDQYALGIIAYRLLGGHFPFEGHMPYALMNKHLNETPRPLQELNPQIPPEANLVIQRALAKDFNARYPDVMSFAEHLAVALPAETEPPLPSWLAETHVPPKKAPRSTPRVRQPIAPPKKEIQTTPPIQQQIEEVPEKPAPPPPPPQPPVLKKSTQPRYVFVSYSTRDRMLMERLTHDLDTMGHLVWYDRELQNRGGQSWWDTILEQIRQADLFIFSLTPDSLESEACRREYGYAADLKKHILPVRLSPMKIDLLPPALLQIQWVDYLDLQVAQPILVESIDFLPEPPALPNPLPDPPPAPIPLINELWQRGTRREEIPASEQMTLLGEMEILVFEGQNLDTVHQLLMQMQARRDVSRMAHQKIEMLLQQFFAPKPVQPANPPADEGRRGRWPFGRR